MQAPGGGGGGGTHVICPPPSREDIYPPISVTIGFYTATQKTHSFPGLSREIFPTQTPDQRPLSRRKNPGNTHAAFMPIKRGGGGGNTSLELAIASNKSNVWSQYSLYLKKRGERRKMASIYRHKDKCVSRFFFFAVGWGGWGVSVLWFVVWQTVVLKHIYRLPNV